MISIKREQTGFSPVAIGLIVVIVAIAGCVGWHVYHVRNKSQNAGPSVANNSKQSAPATGSTSNASLQTDLNSASSSANQGGQDLSATNNSLNDQSTFTSVPQ